MSLETIGPLSPGTSMSGGRYRLQRLLGAGGMATVWLAEDGNLARQVAVKVMADTLAADPDWVRRFQREARAAASLNHPNVVPVFDYGAELGRPFLVMQYIPGGTLAGRDHDGTAAVAVETLARELLDAVAHIHAAGLVHRDIKPANVLIGTDGRIRITDFGIAQPRDATRLTRTGTVVGTAPYLAPEVLGGAPASARSDLFSCGQLLRHAAAGHRSQRLDGLIAALTAADPEQRPPSATAALELLDEPSVARRPRAAGRATESAGPATDLTQFLPTAATRAPGSVGRTPAPRARSSDSGRPCRLLVPGAVVAVALVVLVILISLTGSGGGTAPAPVPAARSASLRQQLQALNRRLAYATRH